MKASELRIGNYVSVDNQDSWRNLEGVTLVVTGINNHMDTQDKEFFPDSDGKVNLKSEFETYGQFSQFIAPIPLTEEWLLKLGFEKDEYNNDRPYYYTFKGFRLNCNLGFLTLHNSNELADFRPIHLKYIHQLQNMFFALCGEELELK